MKYTILLCFALLPLCLLGQGLQFDTLTVKKGYRFKNNHTLYLAYQFIYPTGEATPITKIREQITKDFFGHDDSDTAQQKYEDEIVKEIAGYETDGNEFLMNSDEQNSAIRIFNNRVLVFITQIYWYRGGVHGLEPSHATNYDLQTGDYISLDNLFSENAQTELLAMVKSKYPVDSTAEKMWLTDYFVMLPKGIQFRFNPYQIAAYGRGRIDVTVKYTEFYYLLKPDAIKYFNNKTCD